MLLFIQGLDREALELNTDGLLLLQLPLYPQYHLLVIHYLLLLSVSQFVDLLLPVSLDLGLILCLRIMLVLFLYVDVVWVHLSIVFLSCCLLYLLFIIPYHLQIQFFIKACWVCVLGLSLLMRVRHILLVWVDLCAPIVLVCLKICLGMMIDMRICLNLL